MKTTEKTTVLVDPYRLAAKSNVSSNAYKGLGIHALPGLHEFIGSVAAQHFEPGASLLDLAAGSGAMSLRMLDLGFKVSATDYVTENFKLTSIPFIQGDLNGPFANAYNERFSAIIASEIIEHLENPRHFARECFKLLAPGGRMILTTPNIENPASKASFIRTGSFLWFTEQDYKGQGHIMPLTQWQIHKSFSEAGFCFPWAGSFGEGASRMVKSPRLNLLSKIVTLISATDSKLNGEIFVTVLEKPNT